jgi:hypothetical protein
MWPCEKNFLIYFYFRVRAMREKCGSIVFFQTLISRKVTKT